MKGVNVCGGKALLVSFAVLALSGCLTFEAAAHSRLVRSDPAARAALETAPKEMKLWFNEKVEPAFAKIWIAPAQGAQIPLVSRGDSSDQKLLIVTLPNDLPAGPVNIGFHVLSVDGHTIEDKFTFTVKTGE